jgi:hypothetical protein
MDTSHSYFSHTQNVGIPVAAYTVPVSLCVLLHVMKVKEEFVSYYSYVPKKWKSGSSGSMCFVCHDISRTV